MSFECPIADDYSPDQFDRPTWGRYHVAIIRIDEEGGKRGEMVVDFEVLAGDPAGEDGKVHRSYFAKTTKAMSRIHQFAMACELITSDELKELKEKGEYPVYDFEGKAVGKQLFIRLEKDEFEGKEKAKLGFDFFHPTDSRATGWPRNEAWLASSGYKVDSQIQKESEDGVKGGDAIDNIF